MTNGEVLLIALHARISLWQWQRLGGGKADFSPPGTMKRVSKSCRKASEFLAVKKQEEMLLMLDVNHTNSS